MIKTTTLSNSQATVKLTIEFSSKEKLPDKPYHQAKALALGILRGADPATKGLFDYLQNWSPK